jgi:hypothetical protein
MEDDMYEVIPNQAKNRIYMRLEGFLSDQEVHAFVEQQIAAIKMMKPGFDVINDISNFKPASPEGAKEIERMLKFSDEKGTRYVMLIIGPNYIARMQFDRLHRTTDSKYITEEVKSREDAERRLDELRAAANIEKRN